MGRRGAGLSLSNSNSNLIVLNVVRLKSQSHACAQVVIRSGLKWL
jgi:hypothetical protein